MGCIPSRPEEDPSSTGAPGQPSTRGITHAPQHGADYAVGSGSTDKSREIPPSPTKSSGHGHTSKLVLAANDTQPQPPNAGFLAANVDNSKYGSTLSPSTPNANTSGPNPRDDASSYKSSAQEPEPSTPKPVYPGALSPEQLTMMDLSRKVKKTGLQASKGGGFSDVYQGVLNPEGLKVAIKALRAAHMEGTETDSDEGRERIDKRLKRELRVWMPLKSERVVPCLGFARLDNLPCLISPWYENGNAQEYLKKRPDCDRKAMVAQVAEGLVFLHQRGVIHYDIKSMNILIDDDGKARITDFGIAKILEDVRTGYTTNNDTIHAARISSPEALAGGDRTAKSDVYSFACFALEVMTNKAPFYKIRNSATIITKKVTGTVPSRADFEEIPQEDPLWDLLESCWDMEPEKRPDMPHVLQRLNELGFYA